MLLMMENQLPYDEKMMQQFYNEDYENVYNEPNSLLFNDQNNQNVVYMIEDAH